MTDVIERINQWASKKAGHQLCSREAYLLLLARDHIRLLRDRLAELERPTEQTAGGPQPYTDASPHPVETLESAFGEYKQACYGDSKLHAIQEKEIRQAFFAGIIWMATEDGVDPVELISAAAQMTGVRFHGA